MEKPDSVVKELEIPQLPFPFYVWAKAKIWFLSASAAVGLVPKK